MSDAKVLGENLAHDRWAKQIVGYAGATGIDKVVLTDGNVLEQRQRQVARGMDAVLRGRTRVTSGTVPTVRHFDSNRA